MLPRSRPCRATECKRACGRATPSNCPTLIVMPRRARRRRRGDRSSWSNPLEFAARVPPRVDSPNLAKLQPDCRNNDGAPEIPNAAFQAWLGGGKLMYAKLLSVLSVHFLMRPTRHILLYDEEPNASPEWSCACRVAKCVPTALQTNAYGRPIDASMDTTDRFASDKRGRCGSTQLDLLRIDTLLESGGGAFLDLDVLVLQRLDAWRTACGEAVSFEIQTHTCLVFTFVAACGETLAAGCDGPGS